MVASSTTYTVQLLGIRCLAAQENSGDDVIIKLNGAVIWQSGKLKMHARPTSDQQVSEFDFANGRRHDARGWQMMMPYNPRDFLFMGLYGSSYLELWEDDLLRDDFLGRSPITIRDAGHGTISISFVRSGGNYLLTYKVIA